MNKLFIIISILILLISCDNVSVNKDRKELEEAVKNNGDTTLSERERYYFENLKVEFSTPISFSTADNIAIPILLEQSYVDKGTPDYSYYNIAIVDDSNRVQKMLFNKSVIIKDILSFQEKTIRHSDSEYNRYYEHYGEGASQEDKKEKDWVAKHFENKIFFTVANYQSRKIRNARLYVYDLKDDKLMALSPENADFKEWKYFKGKDEIIIYFQFDDNKNGKYDAKDDENLLLVNPFTGEINQPLFDIHQLKKLKMEVAQENE